MKTIMNATERQDLAQKKIRIEPSLEKRIEIFHIKFINTNGKVLSLNDALVYLLEKGLSTEGLGDVN